MEMFLAMGVIKLSENWEKEMDVVKLKEEKKEKKKDLRYCLHFVVICPKVENKMCF